MGLTATTTPLQFQGRYVDQDGNVASISYHSHDQIASIYWFSTGETEQVKIRLTNHTSFTIKNKKFYHAKTLKALGGAQAPRGK